MICLLQLNVCVSVSLISEKYSAKTNPVRNTIFTTTYISYVRLHHKFYE